MVKWEMKKVMVISGGNEYDDTVEVETEKKIVELPAKPTTNQVGFLFGQRVDIIRCDDDKRTIYVYDTFPEHNPIGSLQLV